MSYNDIISDYTETETDHTNISFNNIISDNYNRYIYSPLYID